MKRRIAAVLLALCMCIGLLPATALAVYDGTIYNENGITVSINGGPTGDYNVTFNIIVDGNEHSPIAVENASFSSTISVEAEGYTYTFDTTGCTVTAGNILTMILGAERHEVTINLASEKTSDDIVIAEGETTYGTFHWAKGSASTSAFSRELTVYVNGQERHTQTIYTPEMLENTATNHQYWFTPNTDEYVVSYEFRPQYTVDTVRRNISVYLTTKCQCGQPTCRCEGGCSCGSGCECDDCAGTAEPGEIWTEYGTITYKPDEDGYNLTVDIYVNGEIAYVGSQIKIQHPASGNLQFDVAEGKGYYYYTDNGYDLDAYTIRRGDRIMIDDGEYVPSHEGKEVYVSCPHCGHSFRIYI